jgi:hypothetical protein
MRRILGRIEALEALAAEKSLANRVSYAERMADSKGVAERIGAMLDALEQKRMAYEALPVSAKIEHKRQQLANERADWETRDPDRYQGELEYRFLERTDPHRFECRCRNLELDILELQGAAPEILWAGRSQHQDSYCFRKALPAIPTLEEAVDIIARGAVYYCFRPESLGDRRAGPAYTTPQTPATEPSPRQRRAGVIELDDYRRERDVLADYRSRDEPKIEPDFV